MLTIGEFSKLSGTSIKTLRHYQMVSLFAPAHVDSHSGYRYYSPEQVTELGGILHLKTLGFSLRQMRDALSGDSARLQDLLMAKRRELERRVRDEEMRLAALDGWLERLSRRETSSHAITLKRAPAQPIASIRASVAGYADAAGLFDELNRFAGRGRIAAGPPAAIWHTCGGSRRPIDCEAYVPLQRPVAGNRRIRVYELLSAVLASVVHRGDSLTTGEPYMAARSWIASHGFEVAGPKREIYWRGGLEKDRPDDLTEIQFPVGLPRRHQ
jgi:DNA-binding transcriptional MerR regulator